MDEQHLGTMPDVSDILCQMHALSLDQEVPSSTIGQSSLPGEHDIQEELYEKIKSMKDKYFSKLSYLHYRVSVEIQNADSHIPRQVPEDRYEKMKNIKLGLERLLGLLQINKASIIQPALRDKIPLYERQIIAIFNPQNKTPAQTQGHQNHGGSAPAPS